MSTFLFLFLLRRRRIQKNVGCKASLIFKIDKRHYLYWK